ncbi:unnamed protein product, partial [Polarella glacialis]
VCRKLERRPVRGQSWSEEIGLETTEDGGDKPAGDGSCDEGAGRFLRAGSSAGHLSNGWVGDASAQGGSGLSDAGSLPTATPLSSCHGKDYWTESKVKQAAEFGVKLWQEGDRWRLLMSMAGLDDLLPEVAMKHFCTWLTKRLGDFKEANGPGPLRRCSAEIDFSNNGMSDESLWMLLESLAQFEVQAAVLKLYKNRISSPGVLALCEFIRNNKRAGPVHEIHISHNEVDDEAAIELCRTMKELKPRYPPRRAIEGMEGTHLVPVWVRLNQNKIRDPALVLKNLLAEGITSCAARSGCTPGKCSRSECPVLHLYLFTDQALPEKSSQDEDGKDDLQDSGEGFSEPKGQKKRSRNKKGGGDEVSA